jgi:hypothetical protein
MVIVRRLTSIFVTQFPVLALLNCRQLSERKKASIAREMQID